MTLFLASLLLTLSKFTTSFSVFTVNVKQVNACWDDNYNNNNGNSHGEDVNKTDVTMNLILFLQIDGRGSRTEDRIAKES